MRGDISKAIKFCQSGYSKAQCSPDFAYEQQDWRNLGWLLQELEARRNDDPLVVLDMSELPENTTVEEFLHRYRTEGIMVLDTVKTNRPINTHLIYKEKQKENLGVAQ